MEQYDEEYFDNVVFSVAYNILGTIEDAQDVVQDINVKLLEGKFRNSGNLRAVVFRAAVNQSINAKKRLSRVLYVGEWLPVPNFEDSSEISTSKFENMNLLNYELAYLLERVSPNERAVFVLRNAFDFEYIEISDLLDLNIDNVRQIHSRVKKKIRDFKHEESIQSAKGGVQFSIDFVKHIEEGNIDALVTMFKEDIGLFGDGGGIVHAIKKPIYGAHRIAKFLIGVSKMKKPDAYTRFGAVQKQPAILLFEERLCTACIILSFEGDKISNIYNVLNPNKLGHLNDFSLTN